MNQFKKFAIFSLILTIPVTLFYITWIYCVLTTNSNLIKIKYNEVIPVKQKLYRIGVSEYTNLINYIKEKLSLNVKTDINIYTESKNISKLNSYLPNSGFKEKKALLQHNEIFNKGNVRYRGDNLYHWIFPEKSYRFKTKKNKLFNGARKTNFTIIKGYGLISHFPYKVAGLIGILSPDANIISLSINNHFVGLKVYINQINENFLRKNNRMPNDIYKGDLIGSGEFIGVQTNLFQMPSTWDKVAYNNHYTKDNYKPLSKMLAENNIHNTNLLSLVDFAKLAFFIDFVGTIHLDNKHNWVLYYDNYFEKFYPIIWDSGGDFPANKNYNISTSALMENLYENYIFLNKKYEYIYNFFKNKEQEFYSLLDDEAAHTKKIIQKHGYRYDLLLQKQSYEEAVINIDKYVERAKKRSSSLKELFLGNVKQHDYSYTLIPNGIRVSIKGSKKIKNIQLNFVNKINLKKIYISVTSNGKTINKEVNFKRKINGRDIILNQELFPNMLKKELPKVPNQIMNKYTFSEATYDILFDDENNNNLKNILLSFANINNETISVAKVDNIKKKAFNNKYNILGATISKNATQIWSEEVYFKGFNIINDNIIIKPGTKIILDSGATIKVLGKVTAIGTKEKPIIFEAKDKTKPWNAFALKDEKASGSIFKHCIFKDGSGDKGDLYEYTAMLSVHNVKDLLVEDCEFYDSHKTDDMVHVIYSDATFKSTKFVRSLSDALDVDISNLVVDNCEFVDSGNDAIDLMTTNAVVTNTKFINSADKGISIGEGSNLLAVNNFIKGSEIGMQSKDTSKAYIYNSSFINNKKAIDAYHKNWRYSEGGTIFIDKSVFSKNTENATVGKKSKVVINGSDIDTPDNFDTKAVRKKKILISDNDFIQYEFDAALFNNRESLIQKQRKGYHE